MNTIPYNKVTGVEYKGRNIAILLSRGYESQEWATYLQWNEKGYAVKKGEKGTSCLTFGTTGKIDTKKDNNTGSKESYAKAFTVFNIAQVEKIPACLQCNERGHSTCNKD